MALTIPLEAHFTLDPLSDPLSTIRRNVDHLIEIVDRYDLHADGDLVQVLESLRKRTATHQLTIAVFSESRESKSSLIQALLKTTLAAASIPPSTAACTYLAYGPRPECAVTLADSMTARLPLEQLSEFVNEKVPGSHVKKVRVRFPNATLESGLVVIDTPELTDDPEALLSCAAAAIAEADACVLVMKAGERLTENVVAFLRRMDGKREKFFFVLESSRRLNDFDRERATTLVSRSLEERCGVVEPQVAWFFSFPSEESDPRPQEGRGGEIQATLLEVARRNWLSLTSNEVARVAGEALTQASGALNLKETASLQRVRLRRAVKALDDISRQSAELALASDAATRALVAPLQSNAALPCAPPSSGAAAEESSWPSPAPTSTTNVPSVPATILSFPFRSSTTWVTPPTASSIAAYPLPGDRRANDTTIPLQPEQERPVPAPEPSAADARRLPLDAEMPIRRETQEAWPVLPPHIFGGSAARSLGWGDNRDAAADEDDEDDDEVTRGGGIALAWRMVGLAALFAAVLMIAWAVLIILRPDLRQLGPSRVVTALLAPLQSGKPSSSVSGAAPLAAAGPVTAREGSNNSDIAQPSEPVTAPPAATPPTAAAAQPSATAQPTSQPIETKTVPAAAIADREKTGSVPEPPPESGQQSVSPEYAMDPRQDAAFESALERWIEAARSGNVQAQAASYAPVVGTYFNSRNVTREQVQAEEERASAGTAGVKNSHITTIGITALGNGQRSVLLQKDWDTPTGQGIGFAGAEFEKLTFAQVHGQWKIVGEQEVRLLKLHRARGSR